MIGMKSSGQTIHYRPRNGFREGQWLVIYDLRCIRIRQRQAEIETINALSKHFRYCCRICSGSKHEPVGDVAAMTKLDKACQRTGYGTSMCSASGYISDLLSANHYREFSLRKLCPVWRRRSIQIAFCYPLHIRTYALLCARDVQRQM